VANDPPAGQSRGHQDEDRPTFADASGGKFATLLAAWICGHLRHLWIENGGTLEHAQQTCPPKAPGRRQIAAHESPRTTKLYDRTTDQVSLDEIERIVI
jgi:hypothetical protein